VLASQFINEAFAKRAGLAEEQMGLGHAYEINPRIEDSFLVEIAQAQLVRQIFGSPPHQVDAADQTQDRRHLPKPRHDAMFNLVGIATGSRFELLGMFSEAIHNPLLMDRYLSLKAAEYIFGTAASPRRRDRLEVGRHRRDPREEGPRRSARPSGGSRARDHLEGDRPRSFRRRERLATAARGTEESSEGRDYTNPFLDALEKGRS